MYVCILPSEAEALQCTAILKDSFVAKLCDIDIIVIPHKELYGIYNGIHILSLYIPYKELYISYKEER